MGLLLWVLPLVAILLFALPLSRKAQHAISVCASALLLILAAMATGGVLADGSVRYAFFDGLFYIDSISIIVLDIVLIIGLMTSVYTIGYLEEEVAHGKIDNGRVKLFYILMYSFIFTMVFALTVKNMGVMWIAIEATTLASAFLVGFYNDKQALEAAWKYVIICSVGISVALLGIIFLHISSVGALSEASSLDWTALFANAKALNGPVLRFAFIFILIGFGTKAGLAPMHTWLPDAHSQAPSPVSALLSGVLLNSAMYAIIRTVAIVNKNLGSSVFTGGLLIAAGVLSIATAAIFILTQKDYKRLLAYSSIEHMGIIALSIGIFTPASLFAAFFHMINHSFTKSMLFLSSGTILQKYGTRSIRKVRGLTKALPVTGTVFLLGLIAIGGTPPFSVFASEFNVLASIFQAKGFLLGATVTLLLSLVFVGIVYTLFNMFHDKKDGDVEVVPPGEGNIAGAVVLVMLLVIIAVTGIFLPVALKHLIDSAQQLIIGG